jgi:hypothetical protein
MGEPGQLMGMSHELMNPMPMNVALRPHFQVQLTVFVPTCTMSSNVRAGLALGQLNHLGDLLGLVKVLRSPLDT